jgi:hypothetical protein
VVFDEEDSAMQIDQEEVLPSAKLTAQIKFDGFLETNLVVCEESSEPSHQEMKPAKHVKFDGSSDVAAEWETATNFGKRQIVEDQLPARQPKKARHRKRKGDELQN